MTKEEHLLTLLSEECAEVAQAVSKTLRFGKNERYEDLPPNRYRITDELNDLLAIVQMLEAERIIPPTGDPVHLHAKKAQVKKYMRYSKECGTLDEHEDLIESAIDFITKVETGRAKSVDSYQKFRDALAKIKTNP